MPRPFYVSEDYRILSYGSSRYIDLEPSRSHIDYNLYAECQNRLADMCSFLSGDWDERVAAIQKGDVLMNGSRFISSWENKGYKD